MTLPESSNSGWARTIALGAVVMLSAVMSSVLVWGLAAEPTAAADSDRKSTDRASGELRPVVLALPTRLPGYFDDPALPAASEGLYRLRAWLRPGKAFPVVGDPKETEGHAGEVRRMVSTLSRLASAYRNGEVEDVLALYDNASRRRIGQKFAEPGYRERWLEGIRKAESFEPLMLWEVGNGYHCVMQLNTKDLDGRPVKSPFAVIFNREFELVAGAMDSPMHANLMRYLNDPTRPLTDLVANYALFEGSKGRNHDKRQ